MALSPEGQVVVEALRKHVDAVVKRIAINAVAYLQEATPVDTGWARANWILSIGTPVTAAVGTRSAVDRSAPSTALRQLLQYRSAMGPVYITNRVPYIIYLNRGWSAQAPSGFVQIAVMRAVMDAGSFSKTKGVYIS